MLRLRRFAPVVLGAVAMLSLPTFADVVQLNPSRDNSIYEELTSNSAGGSSWLFSGLTVPLNARRALVEFDIAGNIPAGSTVNSVTVSFTTTRRGPGSGPNDPATLSRLTADWGEGTAAPGTLQGQGDAAGPGDATWSDSFFGTSTWSTPGGDFLPASATALSPTQTGQVLTFTSTPDLVADVQAWVDNPASNFGWILDTQSGQAGARAYGAREGAANQQPVLTVDFTAGSAAVPGSSPLTMILLGLGAIVALGALAIRLR